MRGFRGRLLLPLRRLSMLLTTPQAHLTPLVIQRRRRINRTELGRVGQNTSGVHLSDRPLEFSRGRTCVMNIGQLDQKEKLQ